MMDGKAERERKRERALCGRKEQREGKPKERKELKKDRDTYM